MEIWHTDRWTASKICKNIASTLGGGALGVGGVDRSWETCSFVTRVKGEVKADMVGWRKGVFIVDLANVCGKRCTCTLFEIFLIQVPPDRKQYMKWTRRHSPSNSTAWYFLAFLFGLASEAPLVVVVVFALWLGGAVAVFVMPVSRLIRLVSGTPLFFSSASSALNVFISFWAFWSNAGGGDTRFERDSTTVQSAQSTHDDHDHPTCIRLWSRRRKRRYTNAIQPTLSWLSFNRDLWKNQMRWRGYWIEYSYIPKHFRSMRSSFLRW